MTLRRSQLSNNGFVLRHCSAPFRSKHREPSRTAQGHGEQSRTMIRDDQREPRAKSRDETFAKQEHLIKTKDFRKVYKDGRSYKAGFIILRLLPNSASTNRVGFSISAKSIKRAFRRNRIKRLFREAYRRNKKILKKGFDIVFVVRRDFKKYFSYIEAQQVFLDLSKRAGILV